MASRYSALRHKKAYGVTVEEFATSAGVAAFNIAGHIANDKINAQRVAAGQQALGPFANIESAVIYAQTGFGLAMAMKKRKGDIDRVGKVMFLASFPSFTMQLIRDTQLILGQTPIVRVRGARGFRGGGIRAAPPMPMRAAPVAVRNIPASALNVSPVQSTLAQEIALAGGVGKG